MLGLAVAAKVVGAARRIGTDDHKIVGWRKTSVTGARNRMTTSPTPTSIASLLSPPKLTVARPGRRHTS